MPAYSVVAQNAFSFQVLLIEAENRDEAFKAFKAYLSAPEQRAHEEYEYTQWVDRAEDDEDVQRSDYRYDFCPYDVERFEGLNNWDGEATAEVQMIHSGGLG